jgi:RNA polymerase sigma-70 factor (ECF subfamily)
LRKLIRIEWCASLPGIVTLQVQEAETGVVNDDEEEPGLHSVPAHQRAALSALVKEYQQPLGGYLLHLLGEAEVAGVLTQETFVCAYREYVARQSGLAVRPWLYRTATRLARRHLDLTRPAARLGAPRVERTVPAPAAASTSEQQALVQSVLRNLQLGERVVLLLCDFERLPDDEAAAILGVSPARLRTRLERARAHFRLAYVEHHALAGSDHSSQSGAHGYEEHQPAE